MCLARFFGGLHGSPVVEIGIIIVVVGIMFVVVVIAIILVVVSFLGSFRGRLNCNGPF